jgi:hypothetical protein
MISAEIRKIASLIKASAELDFKLAEACGLAKDAEIIDQSVDWGAGEYEIQIADDSGEYYISCEFNDDIYEGKETAIKTFETDLPKQPNQEIKKWLAEYIYDEFESSID